MKDNLLSKLESIEDLSTYKEMPRSRTNSINLCSDERSNFQNIVSKLENEVKSLKSKLNESGNHYYNYYMQLIFSKYILIVHAIYFKIII